MERITKNNDELKKRRINRIYESHTSKQIRQDSIQI